MDKPRILIVEDDALIAMSLAHTLSSLGYTVPEPVATGQDAINAVTSHPPDLVLMDIELIGPMNGIEAAEKIGAIAGIPIVYITAYADDKRLSRARLTEPYGYLVKPVQNRELHATIQIVLYKNMLDRQLRESEEKYRSVVTHAGEAIAIIDCGTKRILEVNPAFKRLLGFADEEISALTLYDIMASGTEDVNRIFRKIVSKRQGCIGEQLCRCKDRSEIHAEICAGMIERDGKQALVCVIAHDVTERRKAEENLHRIHQELQAAYELLAAAEKELRVKYTELSKTEEALRESEEKFRLIFENSMDAIFQTSPDGSIQAVNPAACAMLQRTEDEIMRLGRAGIVDSTDPRLPVAIQTRERTDRFEGELTFIRKNGTRFPGEISSSVFTDRNNQKRTSMIVRDITGRKQAENTLRESEEKYRNLYYNSSIGIFHSDLKGRFIDVNPALANLLGYNSPEEVVNSVTSIPEQVYFDPPQYDVVAAATLEAGGIISRENHYRRRDGTPWYGILHMRAVPDLEGKPSYYEGFVEDITERKRAEEQRENLIHELAQKNAELDRFTYTVSHDLKSPLISIRAFLLLLDGDIKTGNNERVTLDLQRISESAEKLEGLITTLLSLSRSGKSVDMALPVPLTDLAREAAQLLEATLQQRGVTLVIPDNLPVVKGDRQRLLQVMTNLLDNAVKFMGEQKDPRIEVSVRTDTGAPVVCVGDNGMGIKEKDLQKVFGLFERFNPEIPGTGIGLATVKRIIEAHGGRIWVESEGEGKGTTVYFTLPGVRRNADRE